MFQTHEEFYLLICLLADVQACRGNKLDAGWSSDAPDKPDLVSFCVPTEADFLYAYSTPPGNHFI